MGLFGKKHSIGKTIAELRKVKGWTQIELAEKLQVSDKAVSKWEKDSGTPSIEFFPALAELFDVSIDYLMTGKETEPEIITMSKIELCAKNDDLGLICNFMPDTIDENKQAFIDYVRKYKAKKVYKYFIEKGYYEKLWGKINNENINKKKKDHYIELMEIDCDLIFLRYISKKYNDLNPRRQALFQRNGGHSFMLYYESIPNKHNKELYDQIPKKEVCQYLEQNFEKLSKQQYDFYFGVGDILSATNGWISGIPDILHLAICNHNNKLALLLIDKIKKTNLHVKEERQRKNKHQYYDWALDNYFFPTINIKKETVIIAYQQKDKKLAEELEKICPLTNYERKEVLVNMDDETSLLEKQKELAIIDGILWIDKLLEINDINIIKDMLYKYPIHELESIETKESNSYARERESQKAFYDAKKENVNFKAGQYITEMIFSCKLFSYSITNWVNDILSREGRSYSKQLEIRKKYGCSIAGHVKDYYTALPLFFKECKDKLIATLQLNNLKEKNNKGLTKEYFISELQKGNIEILIIKLCVKLETHLKCDLGYEGTFEEMLSIYTQNCTFETGELLHKLRQKRNDIVHCTNEAADISLQELEKCIDIISNIK